MSRAYYVSSGTSMDKYHIFLSNDDGVESPGLAAAARALMGVGEVVVVAPKTQQTSMGRARTGNPTARMNPYDLVVEGTKIQAYSLEGSPAACVQHGLHNMPELRPLLLVSGINYGENLGSNVSGSGTVGAAMEGAAMDIPTIAISLETPVQSHFRHTEQDWATAEFFLRYFASKVMQRGLPAGVNILKVDIPACATPETPWRLTTLSPYAFYERQVLLPSSENTLAEYVVTKRNCANDLPGTDIYAIAVEKVVSVTPLTIDFTARASFPALQAWLE